MKLFSRKQTEQPARRLAGDERRNTAKQRLATDVSEQRLFRRNRTLTGSLSSNVVSATEHRADLQSPRIQAHHLARRRRSVLAIFFIVISVCGLLVFILLNFTAQAHVTARDGGVAIEQDRYSQAIEKYLMQHPVERLRPFLNQERLNESVSRSLPEVSAIQSDGARGIGTGEFGVSLRKPVASWMIGTTQYYVDANGVSFQKNYFAPPSVKIVDQSGIPQTSGTAVVSRQFLSFVGRAIAVAGTFRLEIEQVIIPAGSIRQVQIVAVGHSYPVKLSLDRPAGEQVEDMQRALTYLAGKEVTPAYVDVRVSGKAYYK